MCISSSGGYTLTFQVFLLSFFFSSSPFFRAMILHVAGRYLVISYIFLSRRRSLLFVTIDRPNQKRKKERASSSSSFFLLLLLYFLSFLCVLWFLYSSFFFLFFFDVFCVVIRRNDLLYATPSTTTNDYFRLIFWLLPFVVWLALDVAATLFHLYSLIRQSVSDILAFLHHPLRSRTNCVSFFVVVVVSCSIFSL